MPGCADLLMPNAARYPTAARRAVSRYGQRRDLAAVRLWCRLVGGEAEEQAVAAGALQCALAAAAIGATRGMRRIPGFRSIVVAQALPVVVADHRRTCPTLGPVAAGAVFAGRERPSVRRRAGQHVMPIRGFGAAIDHLALLAEGRLLGDLVVGAVKIIDVLRDGVALGILPRPGADAIARIDGLPAPARLRAQIGAPSLPTGANCLCELLAVAVGTLKPAEVGTLAGTGAGEEKRHGGGLLRLHGGTRAQRQQRNRGKHRYDRSIVHWRSSRSLTHGQLGRERRPRLDLLPTNLARDSSRQWDRNLLSLVLPDFSARVCGRSSGAPLFSRQGGVEFSVALGAPLRGLLPSSRWNTPSFIIDRSQEFSGRRGAPARLVPHCRCPPPNLSRVAHAFRGTGCFFPAFPAQLP